MTRRDNFSTAVVGRLAARAGNRCSRPSCRAATSGPSETRSSGVSNVGVAAHITAAAPNGPRYDENLTKAERSSLENGVWLCETHGKLVDNDWNWFTADLLHGWRRLAERHAADEQGRPRTSDIEVTRTLVPFERMLSGDAEVLRREIDAFLSDVGASEMWSPLRTHVYMALYELAINALTHGGATELRLETRHEAVTLIENGQTFELAALRAEGQGGHIAVTELEREATGELTIRHQRAAGTNRWSLVDEVAADGANTPCSFGVRSAGTGRENASQFRADMEALGQCEEIHIYPPALWSVSDWVSFFRQNATVFGDRNLIYHGIDERSQRSIERARVMARGSAT